MDSTLIKALEEEYAYIPKDHEGYLIYGDPIESKTVLIFEKRHAFERAVAEVLIDKNESLALCTLGNPSKEILQYLLRLKAKRLIYLGDLDPVSIYTYFALKSLKELPKPNEGVKLKLEFGISLNDWLENVDPERISIRMSDADNLILTYAKKFKAPELEEELKFLQKGRKFEIEGFINLHKDGKEGFKSYLESLLA